MIAPVLRHLQPENASSTKPPGMGNSGPGTTLCCRVQGLIYKTKSNLTIISRGAYENERTPLSQMSNLSIANDLELVSDT